MFLVAGTISNYTCVHLSKLFDCCILSFLSYNILVYYMIKIIFHTISTQLAQSTDCKVDSFSLRAFILSNEQAISPYSMAKKLAGNKDSLLVR